MKKISLILLVFCMIISAAACNQNSEQVKNGGEIVTTASVQKDGAETAKRNTLNYGLPQEPGKLDPQSDSLLVSKMINRQIYDTLFVVDPETKSIKANLATDWNWLDNLTLEVTIRDDVSFHNGKKLTAEDVMFTLERCKTGNSTATLYKSFDIENSKIIDDTHLQIKMQEPYGAALNVMASPISGIVNKEYFESVDENVFSREPIGSGAFKFDEWKAGDHITLQRNDNYWGSKPDFQTLNLRIIVDNSARAIELETGGIDLTDTLNISDVKRLSNSEKIKTSIVPSPKILLLSFNEDNEILANEDVRRAIACAIDLNSVVQAAYGDGGKPATSSIPSSVFGYKDVGQYEYDPEKAKELLAQAGYPDGFSINIVCPSVATNLKTAEAVKSFLSEVKIDMQINEFDAATWLGSKLRDATSDTANYVLTADTYDPAQNFMNHLEGSGFVTVSTKDETVNKLLNQGRAETDEAKRKEIYSDVQDYIYEHVIEVPLVEVLANYAYQSYVQGFVPDEAVQPDLKTVYFK